MEWLFTVVAHGDGCLEALARMTITCGGIDVEQIGGRTGFDKNKNDSLN